MTDPKRILVLGVGNVLYTDEGLGVRAVTDLEQEYEFSGNVRLMDGGTLGTKLMGDITESDLLIVADAVLGGGAPGDIYRFTGDQMRKSLAFRDSMHQTDLVDTLTLCDLAGHRPEAVVVGMEPEDYRSMGLELTATAKASLPKMKETVLAEVARAGGEYRRR